MRKITLAFLFIIAFICQSCLFLVTGPIVKSNLKKNLTVEKNAIPPDVGKDDSYIVCILQGRESRDKYMRKNFSKEYKGKHIFLKESELKTEKYSDVDKYRYVFTYTRINGSTTVRTTVSGGGMNNSNTSNVSTPSSNYFIMDRKTNTEYNSGYHSSYFGKYILAYATNLEKQRQLNKK